MVGKTWTVRVNDELDPAVTEKAARFLQSFLPDAVEPVWSADHFRWKLGDANPAGRGFMTVAMHNDNVIGVTSITRKRMWDGQQEVRASEIGDTYSHPDFRREGKAAQSYPSAHNPDEYLSRSVFGRLVTETRERAQRAGLSLIYGTPNRNSMPGYVNRLRFFDYQSHFNQYIVRPGAAAVVKRLPPLRPMRGLFHALDLGYAKAMRRLSSGSGRLRAQESFDTGHETDALWHRLRGTVPFGSLRDSAYFRHRFQENPLARYRLWIVHQANVTCGVFVTRVMTQDDGSLVCFLADWLLDLEVEGIFRFAVSHMIEANSDRNTKSYAFWAERNWAGRQGLARLGCIGRSRVPIIFYDHDDSRALEAAGTQFHFTLATSDNV